jgi:hypothetical protein
MTRRWEITRCFPMGEGVFGAWGCGPATRWFYHYPYNRVNPL